MIAKSILLVGETMGLFIAQEEGTLDTVDSYKLAVAGAEYNVAVGMSRLGHHAGYLTRLGNDPFGKRLARNMAENGIDTAGVQWSDVQPTGFMLKSKVHTGDPQVFYFRKGSAASALCVADVESIDLRPYHCLHMTGILPALSPSCLAASRRLMERGREAGLLLSFDPNLRPSLWDSQERMITEINRLAAMSDLVLPGISEGKLLTGSSDPAQIAAYYRTLGVGTVVIKLGAQGAYAENKDGAVTASGFPVPQVVDTVGAGDGFAVGVVSALLEGRTLGQALTRGNAIGAIQVMSVGDNEGLPNRQKLADFMKTEEI